MAKIKTTKPEKKKPAKATKKKKTVKPETAKKLKVQKSIAKKKINSSTQKFSARQTGKVAKQDKTKIEIAEKEKKTFATETVMENKMLIVKLLPNRRGRDKK